MGTKPNGKPRTAKQLLKDQIKNADDIKMVAVEIPEWGKDGEPLTLEVRSLTFPQQVLLEKDCAGKSLADAGLVAIIKMTFLPGDKTPFFNLDDFAMLKTKNFDITNRLVAAAGEVRQARTQKIASAEKKSETAPSESSS